MNILKGRTITLALGLLAAITIPCQSQANVTITGTTGEYVAKEMSLFECREGIPLPLATTVVDGNGAFFSVGRIIGNGFLFTWK